MRCMIELLPKAQVPDDVEDLLWEFLCSLMRSGQILRDYTIVQKDNYFLAVTLSKADALDEQYDSPYVRRDRSRLREIFDFRMTCLGENIRASVYCDCCNRTAMDLL